MSLLAELVALIGSRWYKDLAPTEPLLVAKYDWVEGRSVPLLRQRVEEPSKTAPYGKDHFFRRIPGNKLPGYYHSVSSTQDFILFSRTVHNRFIQAVQNPDR